MFKEYVPCLLKRSESLRVKKKKMLKIQEDGNLILLAVKSRSRKLPQKTEVKKAEITSEEQEGTEVGKYSHQFGP